MVNWSYFIVTLMYLLAGIFGYLMCVSRRCCRRFR